MRNGKPVAFYSDKHGVFRVNTSKGHSASTEDSNGCTQYGNAMHQLDIEMIFANSPEAKGRVEKVNGTLQDRLVKEMRLLGISTMEEGNIYVQNTYMDIFNKRFAVVPRSPVNLHRPLQSHENLDAVFVQKHDRILSKQLTISYERTIYQIETDHPTYAMRHAKVTVNETPTGVITIQYKGTQLSYRIVTILLKTSIVDSKTLNSVVDEVTARVYPKPPQSHPWRQPYMAW